MKQLFFSVLLYLSVVPALNAEDQNYNLLMKMIITSPDTSIRILNHNGDTGEVIEGYFLLPRYDDMRFELPVRAFLQPGGFNFLDQKVFGGMVDHMSKTWAENNFPVTDLETMTNGMFIGKALSFHIKPVTSDTNPNVITLFIKYAVFSLIEQKDYELDYDYSVRLFYKKIDLPLNSETSIDFLNEHFTGHDISFLFTEVPEKNRTLTFEDSNLLIEEIEKSANESVVDDAHLNFGIELYREKNLKPADPFDDGYLAQYKEHHLPGYNVLTNSLTGSEYVLPVNVYASELSFPFHLYNSQKEKLYSDYKTREEFFQSKCNVVIVPIYINADTLAVDLFVNYEKLNIDDNFPRWTPLKKRLSILLDKNYGTRIKLPKENWSASFTRQGEHYNIYGYSDFERFIDEWLIIRLFKM